MKEIIDVVNENGEIVGQIDKDLAHRDGVLHKAIHLWIINDNDEILIQYRCGNKNLYPNTWDCSVGGHVSVSEDAISTVIRETKEELGISVDLEKLEYIGQIRENLKYEDINSNELVDIFILRQNIKLDELLFQRDEVSDARYVSLDDFFKLIDNNKLLPHNEEYKLLKQLFSKKYLLDHLRTIENYPKKGISFKDVTTILKDPLAYKLAIDLLSDKIDSENIDLIVGPEARGIMFAAPVAYKLNKGYIPVRKPGKLPSDVVSQSYQLEYGMDSLEIHKDSIRKGDKVAIIDDLMATGGTVEAIIKLVEKLGGNVRNVLCLIDLPELDGKARLKGYNYDYIIESSEKCKVKKLIK